MEDDRAIVWFDIDNTLYSASARISHAMGDRIHAYFVGLGLSHEEASELHHQYYTQYGLALRGLARHHDVDPLDFDRQCDGSLPLEEMINSDPELVKLFEDIDRTKVRVWALTNAYKLHAQRVLRILELEHLVDGLVYCNYETKDFTCKPEPKYYKMAMQQAGISDPSKCYFVDDSIQNVVAAREQGWGHCVHFFEKELELLEGGEARCISSSVGNGEDRVAEEISDLQQLRQVWPEIFKSA
ncbi:hypothetical protein AX15_007608 [Amanita polypyramis BW_CC]|nr:hypothetical protein AX15_007608 [Amanita polypyramis BW_CC]